MSGSVNFKETALGYIHPVSKLCSMGIIVNYVGSHLINWTNLAHLNPSAAATASTATNIFYTFISFISLISKQNHLTNHPISQIIIRIAAGFVMVATYVGVSTLSPKAALALNVCTLVACASAYYLLPKQGLVPATRRA